MATFTSKRLKAIILDCIKIIAATVILFVLLEGAIRITYHVRNSFVNFIPLPYVVGADYGPVPPWLDSLRLLQSDEELIWKGQPNVHRTYIDVFSPAETPEDRLSLLRQFIPIIPQALRGSPVWKISTNSDGFRDRELPRDKPNSTFRIFCLGDSWTFGANVAQNEAFPQQVGALLEMEFPDANFEVFNLGVFGYASYNGLKMLRKMIHLQPDLVIVGFAMNEASMAGVRDREAKQKGKPFSTVEQSKQGSLSLGAFASEHSELYRLMRYAVLLYTWQPQSNGQILKNEKNRISWSQGIENFHNHEPWMERAIIDYENNFMDMIELAGTYDAPVVLLYPEFSANGPYRKVLQKISKIKGVPLVDSSALIHKARRRIAENLEKDLNLHPEARISTAEPDSVEVIFRVLVKDYPVPKAIYLVGDHPNLGDFEPNKVAMYDNGTLGDQRAGDHVWSYAAHLAPGAQVFYTYTNSGPEGEWEGLDVPAIRQFRVEVENATPKIYAPIETFGKMYMYADPWHTNVEGNKLIARALLDVLRNHEKIKDYLSAVSTRS